MCAASPGLAIVVRCQVQPPGWGHPLTGHLLSHLHRHSSPTLAGAPVSQSPGASGPKLQNLIHGPRGHQGT